MEDVLRAAAFIIGFGAVFVSFMMIEAVVCVRRGRGDIYDFKETLANLVTGASYKIVDGIVIALFVGAFYTQIYNYGLQWNPEITLLNVLLMFIATDLFMYFSHLCQHKIRWFWTAHVTHHSSKNMNLSTALRQNFLIGLNGSGAMIWLPMALIGFDAKWALICLEANLVYQFFLHSEMFDAPKWFGKVFNTPSHHRVHHGSNPEQIDRNFGGVLIVWDKLFGTFQAEETAGEVVYGVARMPEKPYNPFYMQTYELVAMLKDVVKYKDLRILWMPPEWVERRKPAQLIKAD